MIFYCIKFYNKSCMRPFHRESDPYKQSISNKNIKKEICTHTHRKSGPYKQSISNKNIRK